jgi:hypothetical protein
MGEQDLRIDPETGFPFSDRRSQDAKQNLHYVRHSEPADTARDFSRPHTIPAKEYEASTGRNHAQAVEEYEAQQAESAREAERIQRLAEKA